MTLPRILTYFVLLSICLYVLFVGSVPYNEIAAAIIATFLILLTDKLNENWQRIKYLYYTIRYFKTEIRISASYLYRIKINDLYFLIRSQRRPNQFQPVGGVVKYLPEATAFLTSISAKEDDFIPVDDDSRCDLRITIEGRHVFSFMNWYDSAMGRERDCWREFYEELVAAKILSIENFGYVFTRFITRHEQPICFSVAEQKCKLQIADIYELIATDSQMKELCSLQPSQSDKYVWATDELIRRLGAIPKQQLNTVIAPTASWTL